MATTKDKPQQKKTVIAACRITPARRDVLDAIAAEMRPQPSRAQLFELAIEEFIERRGKGKGKG